MSDFYAEPLTDGEAEVLALLAEDLSNKEIAGRLFKSVRTIEDYVRRINSKLDTANRQEIVQRAQALGLLDGGHVRARHNLPLPTTPFVGRETELDQLHTLLTNPDIRLLTILAPGGMGKTRLALEAAEQQLANFGNGVYFVPLQPIRETQNIISQIATSTGFQFISEVDPRQQVLNYLANKHMLLLLDSFEHLLDGGVPLLTDILQAAPDVRLLVTSREKLSLSMETVYTLSGMDFPTWKLTKDALEYDAVQLLVSAARRVKPDWEVIGGSSPHPKSFSPPEKDLSVRHDLPSPSTAFGRGVGGEGTPDNLDDVARLCRLTQGMPLAILLAAGWLDVLSLGEICAEIRRSADFLETEMGDVPERQRSIRAVFETTWARLNDDERSAFMRMSVFRGGCTAKAAQAVTGVGVKTLQSLVNKALLLRNREGRYDIHELLRQYAEVELEAAGEADEVRDAHMNYYADAMQSREEKLKGHGQLEALRDIESDFENVRAAWDWAVQHECWEAIDRMLECFHCFTGMLRKRAEMQNQYNLALATLRDRENAMREALWGRLVVRQVAGVVEDRNMNLLLSKQGIQNLEAAIEIARQDKNPTEMTIGLRMLAIRADWMGQSERALEILQEVLDITRAIGDRWYEARILNHLGYIVGARLDRYDEAYQFMLESLQIRQEIGDRFSEATVLGNLGNMMFVNGRIEEALPYLRHSLAIYREMGNLEQIRWMLNSLALLAISQGDFEAANQLAQDALQTAQESNDSQSLTTALRSMGFIKLCQSDYIRAQQFGEQALFHVQPADHPSIAREVHIILGIAQCGLGKYATAARTLKTSLRDIAVSSDVLRIFECLTGIVLVLAYHEEQPEQALGILSLLAHHPQNASWDLQPQIKQLVSDLKEWLPPEVYDAAWERGKSLDLHEVVQELLNSFSDQA